MLASDRTLRLKAQVNQQRYKVAADAVIHLHALVATSPASGGFLVPVTGAAGERVVGLAIEAVDSRGQPDGAIECLVYKGAARIPTTGADALDQVDVGGQAYANDDEFAVRPSGSPNSIRVGEILGLADDPGYAWVNVGV